MSWRNLLQPLCHALQKTWSHPTVLHRSQVAAALATEALQDHVFSDLEKNSNSQGLKHPETSPCLLPVAICCLILG